MSHHLIDVSAPNCSLTCRKGQFICRPQDGPEKQAPMEDIGAILVNSFSATMHNRVLLDAARNGTIVVFCESFRPLAILLPANRSTDTVLTRGQITLSEKTRQALWLDTVSAKCANQTAFARSLCPDDPRVKDLATAAATNRPDKESRCARIYWGIFASCLSLDDFRRGRNEGGVNNLLNYGYTVLLARMLQKMIAVGLDPTFGIGHAVRERATPLAYDLMEPFRVIVDAHIIAWIARHAAKNEPADYSPLEVTQEYKRWVAGFLETPVPYRKKTLSTEHLMEQVLRTFRDAVVRKQQRIYKPWTLGDTKWDGFW